MKFKKQVGSVTQPEISQISKTKTLFVDDGSSSRAALSNDEAIVNSDITGICGLLMAKGHSKRIYGMISDVKIIN